jgi:hypothetical protein
MSLRILSGILLGALGVAWAIISLPEVNFAFPALFVIAGLGIAFGERRIGLANEALKQPASPAIRTARRAAIAVLVLAFLVAIMGSLVASDQMTAVIAISLGLLTFALALFSCASFLTFLAWLRELRRAPRD